MPRYRHRLPQLHGQPLLTDGGIETTLLFHHRIDLPEFATFPLLDRPEHAQTLADYSRSFIDLVRASGFGLLLESLTWRAHADWAGKLGYTADDLPRIWRESIQQLVKLRDAAPASANPLVISACMGPRRDGYAPDLAMTADEARAYHAPQVRAFAQSEADLLTAYTLTNPAEAVGIALAAQDAGIPCAISFTLETDGRLPSGQPLREAIEHTDQGTDQTPAYYMINCAHPSHFRHVLEPGAAWNNRIQGVRANASCKSHAELDEAEHLDIGDPEALARDLAALQERLPRLSVLGGCCGTDLRHIRCLRDALLSQPA
ncbi:MAG: homocysteine S-methyltransferase family protein [Planctomycetota bacterium]